MCVSEVFGRGGGGMKRRVCAYDVCALVEEDILLDPKACEYLKEEMWRRALQRQGLNREEWA